MISRYVTGQAVVGHRYRIDVGCIFYRGVEGYSPKLCTILTAEPSSSAQNVDSPFPRVYSIVQPSPSLSSFNLRAQIDGSNVFLNKTRPFASNSYVHLHGNFDRTLASTIESAATICAR